MPQYLYTNDEGVTITHTQSAKLDIPDRIVKDGKEYLRDIVREHEGVSHHPGNWPMTSNAMQILKSDIGTEMQDNASRGLNIEYKPSSDGCALTPVFADRNQRARYMEAKGYFDANAGYSDRAPHHARTR